MRNHFVFENGWETVILTVRSLEDLDMVLLEVVGTIEPIPALCSVFYLLQFPITTDDRKGNAIGICAVPRPEFDFLENLFKGKFCLSWGDEFLDLAAEPIKEKEVTKSHVKANNAPPTMWMLDDEDAEEEMDFSPEASWGRVFDMEEESGG